MPIKYEIFGNGLMNHIDEKKLFINKGQWNKLSITTKNKKGSRQAIQLQ